MMKEEKKERNMCVIERKRGKARAENKETEREGPTYVDKARCNSRARRHNRLQAFVVDKHVAHCKERERSNRESKENGQGKKPFLPSQR